MNKAWCVQIDVTNYCVRSCLYCSRYNRHLRPDQRAHMPVETFSAALRSLRHWPGKIGVIGGEPLLHPEFKTLNALLRRHFPPHHSLRARLAALLKRRPLPANKKLGLWTSGLPGTPLADPRHDPDIAATYGFIAYNPHDAEQMKKCRHQPLTVAIREAVPDEALCPNCGMAIPMERELLLKQSEKISPQLLEAFRARKLKRIHEQDVEIFSGTFSKEELQQNILSWYPGNYREDVKPDEQAREGRGFPGELR